MRVKGSAKRSFFTGRWDLTVKLTAPITTPQLSTFVDDLVSQVIQWQLPPTLPELGKWELKDQKGRDLQEVSTFYAPGRPAQDEMLAVVGTLYKSSPPIPLAVYLTTKFSRFDDDHRIYHTAQLSQFGFDSYIPAPLALKYCGRLLTFQPTTLRYAVGLYSLQQVLMLGVAAQITERVCIEADSNNINIDLTSLRCATPSDFFSRHLALFERLQIVFQNSFNMDLLAACKAALK